MTIRNTSAVYWYLVSLVVFWLGFSLAASHYPGGYDWAYTVVSALASKKENPHGGYLFSAALGLSMLLLWPYISAVRKALPVTDPTVSFSIRALRVGLIAGFLLGVERLLVFDISAWLDKSHEMLALIYSMCLYVGVLGLLWHLMKRNRIYLFVLLSVAAPLLILGGVEFGLYLAQRDIGWVGVDWRAMDTPVWLSFAFWQWLVVVFLWLGLGVLSSARIKGAEL